MRGCFCWGACERYCADRRWSRSWLLIICAYAKHNIWTLQRRAKDLDIIKATFYYVYHMQVNIWYRQDRFNMTCNLSSRHHCPYHGEQDTAEEWPGLCGVAGIPTPSPPVSGNNSPAPLVLSIKHINVTADDQFKMSWPSINSHSTQEENKKK